MQKVKGFPRFAARGVWLTFMYRMCVPRLRSISGGTVFEMLMALSDKLTVLVRAVRGAAPMHDDLDGACPACDHPFGSSSHVCFGSITHAAA
jgi:hypothetical protein